jgi:hypothetical protein
MFVVDQHRSSAQNGQQGNSAAPQTVEPALRSDIVGKKLVQGRFRKMAERRATTSLNCREVAAAFEASSPNRRSNKSAVRKTFRTVSAVEHLF